MTFILFKRLLCNSAQGTTLLCGKSQNDWTRNTSLRMTGLTDIETNYVIDLLFEMLQMFSIFTAVLCYLSGKLPASNIRTPGPYFWDKLLILILPQFISISMITSFHRITPPLQLPITVICNCQDDITPSLISMGWSLANHTVKQVAKNVFMNPLMYNVYRNVDC